jgi:hypothetical protein
VPGTGADALEVIASGNAHLDGQGTAATGIDRALAPGPLTGKVAPVTGSTSGIGFGIAAATITGTAMPMDGGWVTR